MLFETLPQDPNRNFVIRQLGKLFFLFITFCVVMVCFHIIAISIRYSFITLLTLASVVCGRRFRKAVGWLHRYTDLITESE
jgi:hypothetical protein